MPQQADLQVKSCTKKLDCMKETWRFSLISGRENHFYLLNLHETVLILDGLFNPQHWSAASGFDAAL